MAEEAPLNGAVEKLVEIETRYPQVVAGLEKLQAQYALSDKEG